MDLVTFDLDGTLLESTVFQVVGDALGHTDRIRFVDELYFEGLISVKTAFYAEYPLFLNVPVETAHDALAEGDWVEDIPSTVSTLQDRGLDVWVVTDQPDWATSYLQRFGIEDGVSAETTRWEDDRIGAAVDVPFEKRPALTARLDEAGIDRSDVVHVGNGHNDVPVFEAVGGSVAFNPSNPEVSKAADHTVEAGSLAPVLDVLDV